MYGGGGEVSVQGTHDVHHGSVRGSGWDSVDERVERRCVSASQPGESRRWGVYYVTGLIMKLYFRVWVSLSSCFCELTWVLSV